MTVAVPLSDTTKFQTLNGLWTGRKPPFANAGVIRNTNFTASGDIDYSDVAYLDVETSQLAKRQLRSGDIIIERSGGGPKQAVGRVVFFDRTDGSFSFSNFTSAIRIVDHETFAPRYVFYHLLELYRSGRTEDLQRFTTGIRNLDFTAYKDRASIPLVGITEQREIARVLDEVRRSIGLHSDVLSLALDLKTTLLHAGFVHAPSTSDASRWRTCRIGEVATLHSGGTPSRAHPEYWDGGSIPWVKTAEVNNCIINATEEKITPLGLTNSSARLFAPGTLLMAMYGQGVTRGKVAILGIEATTNQACVAFFPEDGLRSDYLYYLFQARYEQIREFGHGANQKNLSGEILKGIEITYPLDTVQQEKVAAALRQVDARIDLAKQTIDGLEALFSSLLDRLASESSERQPSSLGKGSAVLTAY